MNIFIDSKIWVKNFPFLEKLIFSDILDIWIKKNYFLKSSEKKYPFHEYFHLFEDMGKKFHLSRNFDIFGYMGKNDFRSVQKKFTFSLNMDIFGNMGKKGIFSK